MKKIQDLLFDLEKKVESSLAELSKLKNEKNDLWESLASNTNPNVIEFFNNVTLLNLWF